MTAWVRTSGYSLEIEDPRTGVISIEKYTSIAAVVTHAAKLIQDGFNIGIWSAASLEQEPRDSFAANEDSWTGAPSKRLAG